jgi:hypothetical protein
MPVNEHHALLPIEEFAGPVDQPIFLPFQVRAFFDHFPPYRVTDEQR